MNRKKLKEKLLEEENEKLDGLFTYLASEQSLAKNWLTAEEDKAWEHLQNNPKSQKSSAKSPTRNTKK